jgi:hypothetical protein
MGEWQRATSAGSAILPDAATRRLPRLRLSQHCYEAASGERARAAFERWGRWGVRGLAYAPAAGCDDERIESARVPPSRRGRKCECNN